MKKYVSVFNDVICLEEIKKIRIIYNHRTNYKNNLVHSLFVTYKDGAKEEYNTDDYLKAKQDYENLKSALLEIDVDHPTEESMVQE